MSDSSESNTANPAMGYVEVVNSLGLPEGTSKKFLDAFASSLASDVTASLVEKLVESRTEARLAKAAAEEAKKKEEEEQEAKRKAEEKEETAEEPKQQEKPKHVEPEEMVQSLEKIDLVYDQKTGERNHEAWNPLRAVSSGNEKVPDKYDKWALVLERAFSWEGHLECTRLHVKSPLIREVIKKTVPPEKANMEVDDASVYWPCDNLFRYRAFIREGAVKEGELAVKHCEVLMQLIEKEYASKIHDINTMFPKEISTYEILREAYWPGELLVSRSTSRIYRITAAQYENTGFCPSLRIDADYIAYDGEIFGTREATFNVPAYSAVQYINKLDAFPLKFHPDQAAVKQQAVENGKKFSALQGQHYKAHQGVAVSLRCCRTTVDSRVMIDTATFNRVNPNSAVSVTKIESGLGDDGELTDELLMLCTDQIPIFSIQDKCFYFTSTSQISDISFNEKVFDQLVLPQSQKELVRVLVENHSRGAAFDDFVEGKGKGLISVLHGPPGVGKTMTAEAVAEYTRRPLYIITSGELGSQPSEMETELERVLDLAKTFRAVLLLDEADVFLEQRTCHDLIRNALVSIFLRQLEYYQGILFLTTNRVGTFDEAFHSRIHISLYYRNLTVDARQQVWRNFAATLETDLAGDDFAELAATEINGRQIKNAMRTAQALAADKGEKISRRHVVAVLEVMKGFDLARARGDGVEK